MGPKIAWMSPWKRARTISRRVLAVLDDAQETACCENPHQRSSLQMLQLSVGAGCCRFSCGQRRILHIGNPAAVVDRGLNIVRVLPLYLRVVSLDDSLVVLTAVKGAVDRVGDEPLPCRYNNNVNE
jgi:hypothetical protein